MPLTKSVSELQRNISSIYELCHDTQEPVYLTRNGQSDLVIMDARAFEERMKLQNYIYEREQRIYEAIIKSEDEINHGQVVTLSKARQARSSL